MQHLSPTAIPEALLFMGYVEYKSLSKLANFYHLSFDPYYGPVGECTGL